MGLGASLKIKANPPTDRLNLVHTGVNLETGMERDEDGVVLGSTGLTDSQRLHQ
jgi:hypothetical protein